MDLLVAIVTSIFSFILALFVFLKNNKSGTHVYFAGFIVTISLYSIFNYLALHTSNPNTALQWSKYVLYSVIPVGPLFFSFIKVFPKNKFIFNKRIQFLLLIWVLLNYLLATFDLIFSKITVNDGLLTIHPGPAIASFVLLQVGSALGGVKELVVRYIRESGVIKRQLQYVVFGISVSFLLMIISTMILPLVLNITFLVPFSPLFLLFGAFAIGLSIFRHKLLDIRPLLARTVSYSLVIIVFAIFFIVFSVIISFTITGRFIDRTSLLLITFFTLFVSFTFQPVMRFLRKQTDQIFYKDYYNPEEVLYELSKVMASSLKLEDIAKKITHILVTELKVTHARVIVLDESEKKTIEFSSEKSDLGIETEAVSELLKRKSVVIQYTERKKIIKEILASHEVAASIALGHDKKAVGLLLLGEKKSGELFNDEDIRVLEILSSQLSVAIKNALSYEQISTFNITLKEEVEKATAKLQDANNRLKELDKLKDEFVSIASHELRTPMTAIKYYLWMALSGRGGKVSKKQKYYLERSYTSTNRLIKLVNDMLNISRIEAGRIMLSPTKARIETLAKTVIDELEPKAKEQNIELQLTAEKNLPAVIADRDKVIEVIMNLMGNALKFTPDKGKITLSFEEKEHFVVTHITDTGVGIDPEKIDTLFQKFGLVKDSYQANQVVSEGTGLGLYITKSIVELHGGQVTAYSAGPGKGSTFSFSLPVYTQRKEAELKKKFAGKDAGIIAREV